MILQVKPTPARRLPSSLYGLGVQLALAFCSKCVSPKGGVAVVIVALWLPKAHTISLTS